MGYHMSQRDSFFRIPKDRQAPALAAIQALCSEERKMGGVVLSAGVKTRHVGEHAGAQPGNDPRRGARCVE